MEEKNRTLEIPELSLIVLIGASSSGKSTFARKHFRATEIVSSDQCRAIVSDDENSMAATEDAFDLARYITGKRLRNGLLTVIDATNVQSAGRKDWVRLAREHHVLPVAIVINVPEKVCEQRHQARADRDFGNHVIPMQISQLKKSMRQLKLEGFRHVFELRGQAEVDAVTGISRTPLYNNKKQEHGPFDIIGDIHGCYGELVGLLAQLGYSRLDGSWSHPEGRKPVFLGDLVDRGPDSPGVLRLVMDMVGKGQAWCVPGNHDVKLMRWLNGKNVQLKHGLQQTVEQLLAETAEFRKEVKDFIDGLVSHYVFDDGSLVVAHAGLREEMQGRGSGAVREFCLYGETSGEIDEFGLPVRYNWASEYRGKATVVYGHTPVPYAQWLNRTIDIDTGCVFGGSLTALRYPEKQLVSVAAARVYCEPARPLELTAGTPLELPSLSLQQASDDVLEIEGVLGKNIITTTHGNNITVKEENAIAALEVMSRFAVNPKWLIYLPPTMSPSETSALEDYLEYPKEAFDYFRGVGVEKVVCEEKHMGSRAVVIACRDETVVRRVFGIEGEGIGVIYTRTGRPFFSDKATEQAFLQRINSALGDFYAKFNTDWVCLDAELMPWSAKARLLLETQYGAVGAAGSHALQRVMETLRAGVANNPDVAPLLEKYGERQRSLDRFVEAYRRYCWPVNSLDDYRLAPFHVLATEGRTWLDKDNEWHMETIAEFCGAGSGILMATPYLVVDLNDEVGLREATDWWLSLTGAGGEGMVVKSYDFLFKNRRGLVQPAIKIRGREYLRIIYGPEYTAPEHLTRLKGRGLSGKRGLALREFALGIEGLDRFAKGEPLRRVHECVFGVLALESEPIDPRL
jgi:protein phosphatase